MAILNYKEKSVSMWRVQIKIGRDTENWLTIFPSVWSLGRHRQSETTLLDTVKREETLLKIILHYHQ